MSKEYENQNGVCENRSFYGIDPASIVKKLGPNMLHEQCYKMLLARTLERKSEVAYFQGHIGGFFHSYIGQEAIQVAAVAALGKNQWWATSYRCHVLALLLGITPQAILAELFGKASGNAKGRGGSMHLFSEDLLGGFGIVGGQIPIATGAAFAVQYKSRFAVSESDGKEMAICFLGDGAVAQGAFHESLNLAALWRLPILYVVENNRWGMGTPTEKALAKPALGARLANAYGMEALFVDGMDFFSCYAAFEHARLRLKSEGMPILLEINTERFRGHSVSDQAAYRSKESLKACMERDPIRLLVEALALPETQIASWQADINEEINACLDFAQKSPWPDGRDVQ